MIVLAVDDEYFMLDMLVKALNASPDVESVYAFSACSAALEWVASNRVDAAFLDINMRGMTGIELARHIRAVQPECSIVFCTGYSDYAVDAFRLRASGYVMKPVTPQAVQTEIEFIKKRYESPSAKALTARCFGTFEVLAQGAPLHFKRTKTKELLAYLIDRNGAGVTSKQICAVLWEDDFLQTKHMNYFWQLLDDLRQTLRDAGAEQVLTKTGNSYAINTDQLDCDYYQHLKTGSPAFHGEYMTQYSWAEETAGFLFHHR